MSSVPAKASAFVIIKRPGNLVLCTIEGGRELSVGVPGGKWIPEQDGIVGSSVNWQAVLEREYREEVGSELPTDVVTSGFIDWGSDAYQVRFRVLLLTNDAADKIPIGEVSDPGGKVQRVEWISQKLIENDVATHPVRPHILVAFKLLKNHKIIAREILRPPKTSTESADDE